MSDHWRSSRFDQEEAEPMGPMASLMDIMLVFSCGLIAALIALSPELQERFKVQKEITQGRELPSIPEGIKQSGDGYEPIGQVYKDPKTGKLILIGE
ncbi:hypothetical protein EOPP23_02870 [Endozoicomonas sp. OPT23]|uniref:hypothetical protein n=1 Tax=Endozoicomonas sp. OPT23 TaxID=2072845 RepID=UPI00129BC57D|nr:hypothetical protein [Endozoicomonas sp. OPT23]MRI31940.1 hypothetical protein [Endozoicomonas sp. OPT23]